MSVSHEQEHEQLRSDVSMLLQFMDEFDIRLQARLDALKVQYEQKVQALQQELAQSQAALKTAIANAKQAADAAQGTANSAQKTANSAQAAANDAQKTANAAQIAAKKAQATADKAVAGDLDGLNVAQGGTIKGQLTIDVSDLPEKGGKRRNALRLVTHPNEGSAVIIAQHNQAISFWNGGANNHTIDVIVRKVLPG